MGAAAEPAAADIPATDDAAPGPEQQAEIDASDEDGAQAEENGRPRPRRASTRSPSKRTPPSRENAAAEQEDASDPTAADTAEKESTD